jgi:hypothetical protein
MLAQLKAHVGLYVERHPVHVPTELSHAERMYAAVRLATWLWHHEERCRQATPVLATLRIWAGAWRESGLVSDSTGYLVSCSK